MVRGLVGSDPRTSSEYLMGIKDSHQVSQGSSLMLSLSSLYGKSQRYAVCANVHGSVHAHVQVPQCRTHPAGTGRWLTGGLGAQALSSCPAGLVWEQEAGLTAFQ